MSVYKKKNGKWISVPFYQKKLKAESFSTKAEALAYEAKAVAEARGQTYEIKDIPLECFTLGDLCTYYREHRLSEARAGIFSIETYGRDCQILTYIENCHKIIKKPVRELTPDDIDLLIAHWWQLPTAKDRKRKSFEHDLKVLKKLFSFYKERKRDQFFHSPILKSHKKRCYPVGYRRQKLGAIRKDDIAAWFEKLKDMENPIYFQLAYVMLHLGLRRGEALGIEWKHLNFKTMTVSIEQQVIYPYKSGSPYVSSKLKTDGSRREVPFSKGCAEIFQALRKRRPFGRLFWDGTNEFISKTAINRAFNLAFDRANLNQSGTHTCRRTFVTLGSSQHGLEIMQRAVGHANRATTEGYLDLNSLDQVNVAESIEQLLTK
jgi:integrase